jgi:hypothetical protein
MSNLSVLHLRSFLPANETGNVLERLGATALYRNDQTLKKATLHCKSTMYGGLPFLEPYHPMPPWLAELRRRIERHIGVYYGYFDVAVILCIDDSTSDCVDWQREAPEIFGQLSTFAFVTFASGGESRDIEMRSINIAERPPRAWSLADGDVFLVKNYTHRHYEHRVPRRAKRGNSDGGKPALYWQIVFKHISPVLPRPAQRYAIDALFKQYRYGKALAAVKREPSLSLNMQEYAVSPPKKHRRQLSLNDIFIKIENLEDDE